ncbi:MAG: phage integrase SAM-like domain-containing protein [Parabacteroides sp.]|nr:phage integrase SAM-like domain-containing protein [Parabacteroides sp.]MDY6006468.1 phage integrase SAM-like domain-containing protein [Parabacteroides sp.]
MATFKAVLLAGDVHRKLDGTKNIKIRIYHNKSVQYLSTPYYLRDGELKDGLVVGPDCDSELLNYELGEMMQKCREVCIRLGSARTSRMSCSEIKEQIVAFMEPDYQFIDFVSFCRDQIDRAEKDKTKEWYRASLNSLIWFFGRDRIDARDITAQRVIEWRQRLETCGQNGKPMSPGGISNYMRGIRSLYNKAKCHFNNEDYNIIRIPNDPFSAKVKIPRYRRSRKSLSIDEMIRIRDGHFSTDRANMARDVFMVMFYLMGINVKDLWDVKRLTRGRFEYERSKTQTEDNIYRFPLSIRIEPELEELSRKYSSLEFLSDLRIRYKDYRTFGQAVNKGLEVVSDELNLHCHITTNWARHTWASIARNRAGVPKADIDFCLGHVNNDYKMADIYIDVDYSIFDQSNRAVLDLLQKK